MSLAKVVNNGSQVKREGLVNEIPNSVGAKQYSVCSLTKDCQTIHLSARVHEGTFVHKSDSAYG